MNHHHDFLSCLNQLENDITPVSSLVKPNFKDQLQEYVHNVEKDIRIIVSGKHKVLQDNTVQFNEINSEIDVLKGKRKAAMNLVALQEDNLQRLEKQCKILQKAPSDNSSLEKQHLQDATNLYSKYLGLDLKKIKGGKVQFVFKQIDEKNPDDPYYFYLNIDENRKYIVSDSSPVLPSIEEHVNDLNNSNDLKKFVSSVRSLFKKKYLG